jgi:hypothetical protein
MDSEDKALERHLVLRDAGKLVDDSGLVRFLQDLEDYTPEPNLVLVRLYAARLEAEHDSN